MLNLAGKCPTPSNLNILKDLNRQSPFCKVLSRPSLSHLAIVLSILQEIDMSDMQEHWIPAVVSLMMRWLSSICKDINIIAVFHFVLKWLAKELKHTHALYIQKVKNAFDLHMFNCLITLAIYCF